MKTISSLFILFFITFFVGCADKTNALRYFENDKLSAKAIQYTKKRDVVYNNEVEALVFLTHLNNIDGKYENDKVESFILGVQIANKEKENFFKDEYNLYLEENKPMTMISLDPKSKLVQSIPLGSPWARYFLVEFNNEEEKRVLNLNFIHSKFGSTSLSFQK